MEQVSEIQGRVKDAERRYIRAFEAEDTEAAREIAVQQFAYLKDYVVAHPDQPGASYAVMELTSAEDAVEHGAKLTGEALVSMIYPLAQSKIADAEERLAKRKKQSELETTAAIAPDFTLSDMEGNRVALRHFRGKWVRFGFLGFVVRMVHQGISRVERGLCRLRRSVGDRGNRLQRFARSMEKGGGALRIAMGATL